MTWFIFALLGVRAHAIDLSQLALPAVKPSVYPSPSSNLMNNPIYKKIVGVCQGKSFTSEADLEGCQKSYIKSYPQYQVPTSSKPSGIVPTSPP